jgi:hypothetical protein
LIWQVGPAADPPSNREGHAMDESLGARLFVSVGMSCIGVSGFSFLRFIAQDAVISQGMFFESMFQQN